MKIACVGAGPAGLYLSILMKLRDPGTEVTIFERNPVGVTHGWGVVFWDDLVADLQANDPESAAAILDESFAWDGQVVHIKGETPTREDGGGYGISRQTLLDILSERARDLGVTIRYEDEITSLAELPEADVVVAADGVGSQIRRLHGLEFDARTQPGRNKYVWLATPRLFEAFTFGLVHTEAGWIWCHAYGYSKDRSTFIVECSPETWKGLGFDELGADESLRLLEALFDEYLDGQPLLTAGGEAEGLPWLHFRNLTNTKWYSGNVVLVGDAAHTTHFTIGSGTRLAMQDSIALANRLHGSQDVHAALEAYEAERQVGMLRPQREARLSSTWFENLPRYAALGGPQVHAFLVHRRSRVAHHVPPRLYYGLLKANRIPLARKLYRWAAVRAEAVEKQRAAHRRHHSLSPVTVDEKDA